MAKLTAKPTLDIAIQFTVNESEARALDALAGYGDDQFISAFKIFLGESYLKPHEAGLRTFLKTIRQELADPLAKMDDARKSFNGNS
jgi:hypothetical protein